MSRFEFMVLPAPVRPRKLTGLSRDQDRFCATITDVMCDMGLQGWEFVGAETLPCEERRLGLFSAHVVKSCLVFRREIAPLGGVETKVEPKRIARSHVVARVRDGGRRVAHSGKAGTDEVRYALPGDQTATRPA